MKPDFTRATTFVEAFTASELNGLPESFCEVSNVQPRVIGHQILGSCDQCYQDLMGGLHLCVGEVMFEDFNFDDLDLDDEDEDDDE